MGRSGTGGHEEDRPLPESRLDALRDEALRRGPPRDVDRPAAEGPAGYYGRPVLKPPVWTWEVPVYFFVGGLAGMSAVIALAALPAGQPTAVVRAGLWIAAAGAVASSVLLVLDLGRPQRFLYMLRVFKWRSPMSVGAWTLAVFGAAALPGAFLMEHAFLAATDAGPARGWFVPAVVLLVVAALSGAVLATYTGVLLGATAIPVWTLCHRLLPVHFGVAGLGSAAALLELLGYRLPALHALGFAAAAAETVLGVWIERKRSVAARPLHAGGSGFLLRTSAVLSGPASLALRAVGYVGPAAAAFLAGALLSRFGWLAAGRASALDPEAVLGSDIQSSQ